jgi:Polyketide cyclase / dehydrase and lipid transport
MSVDVKAEVLIERPRSVVAEFIFDPKSDPIWHTSISKSFPQTAGLLKQGSKVEHIGTFAGKAYSADRLVMRDEPEKSLDITSNEPFEMKIRYKLDDVPEGTRVSVRVQSVGELLFQMPPVVLSKKVQDTISDDLKRLKRHLELDQD